MPTINFTSMARASQNQNIAALTNVYLITDLPKFPAKILDGSIQQEEKIRIWIERDLNAIFPDTNMGILVMHLIGCIKSRLYIIYMIFYNIEKHMLKFVYKL